MADETVQVEISAIDRASQVFRGISSASNDLMQSVSSLLTPTKLLGGFIGYELVNALRSAVDGFNRFALQVRDLSYLSGGTTQQVSALVNGMEALGVETGTVERGLSMMSRAVEAGSPVFNRLGISIQDSTGHAKTAYDLYLETIDALGGMTDSTTRNALARELWGRGWIEMVPILAMGSKALIELGTSVGKTITPADIQAAREYQIAMHELHEVLTGLAVSVGRELVPQLTQLAKEVLPAARDVAQILVGSFQAFGGTVALLATSLDQMVRPFAWLTDAVGLTSGQFEYWSQRAEASRKIMDEMADKSLYNLSLGYLGTAQATGKATEAQKQQTDVYHEAAKLLEQRLKLEEQLAQIQTQTLGAMAQGYAERYALQLHQINDQMQKLIDQVKVQQANHTISAEAAKTQLAAIAALGGALRDKALRDFEDAQAKYLVMVYDANQKMLGVWQDYSDQRLGLEREITATTLNELDRQLRAVDDWVRGAIGKLREKLGFTRDAEAMEERIVAEGARRKLQIESDYRDKIQDLLRWQTDSFEEAYRLQGEVIDASLWKPIAESLSKLHDSLGTFWANVEKGFVETFRNVQRSLSDTFFDVLTGQFNKLGDVVKQFGFSMVRTFADIMASEATKGLLGLLPGVLGGGGGGIPWGSIASGIGSAAGGAWDWLGSAASDVGSWLGFLQKGMWNVPDLPGREWAILHPGEMVLPPDVAAAVRALGGLPGAQWTRETAHQWGGGGTTPGLGTGGPAAPTSADKLSEAISQALGAKSGWEQAGFIGAHLGSFGLAALGLMSAPGPLGALAAMLGIASRAAAIDAWGLEEAFGLNREQALSIAESFMSMDPETIDAVATAFGGLENALAAAAESMGAGGGFGPGYSGAPAGPAGQPGGWSDVGAGWGGGGAGDVGGSLGGSDMGSSADSGVGGGGLYARGGLFTTKGPTRMIVGDAGTETVAVVRNPREVEAGGSGMVINLTVTGNHIYGAGGAQEFARMIADQLRQLAVRMRGVDLFPARA